MTVYIERSLVGTENNDQLSYSITHVGNGNSDVFIHYTSIYGLGGEDEITNDADWKDIFIDAGAGNDRFKAGAYSSGTVLGGEGDDQLNCYVEDTSYTILGEAGNDTVSYYVDYYDKTSRLDGGDGEDHLVFGGNYSTDRITGFETLALKGSIRINKGKLSDFKSVDPGSATIMFAHAADVADVAFVKGASSIAIIGSSVADNLDLTEYNRSFSISGGSGGDVIIAGAGRLQADGGPGADYIRGSDRNDILSSGPLPKWGTLDALETVLAGGGDDVVIFSGSQGVYDGGEGNDTLRITPPDHGGDLTLSRGDAVNFERLDITSFYELSIDGDLIKQFETVSAREATLIFSTAVTLKDMPEFKVLFLTLVGSMNNDALDFTTSKVRLTFDGEGGNDLLRAGLKSVTADGGVGDDRLYGSILGDTIVGGMGDDMLSGGAGKDSLDGGHGLDIVHGGAGNDWFKMDQLKASDHQTLYGDGGDDTFYYGDDESINGSTPWILKQAATLNFVGGGGKDYLTISGNLRNVQVTGVEGLSFYDDIWVRPDFLQSFDSVYAGVSWPREMATIHLSQPGTMHWKGGWINAEIIGSKGVDILDFSKAYDMPEVINLGAGDDEIRFGKGSNDEGSILTGGAGDDRFHGGAGNNYFRGGSGHDIYVARDNKGVDSFIDFTSSGESGDIIDLSGVSSIKDYKDLSKNHLKTAGDFGYAVVYIDMDAQGSLVLGYAADFDGVSSANFLF